MLIKPLEFCADCARKEELMRYLDSRIVFCHVMKENGYPSYGWNLVELNRLRMFIIGELLPKLEGSMH